MERHPYIAIEGAIGVGKTTLARVLGEALPAEVLLEVFEQNPFLSDFYADRERYAFQTQIFFLLSRYRQQHNVIADTLRRSTLASDYLFAKDWLFAHLNLQGDELAMYERVHAILGEQIPTPDLVVYLRAGTDTLMERIAFRDRPYERQMERDYIQALQVAYDQFFAEYEAAPVLRLDTDRLDIVRSTEDRGTVVGQVKAALQTTVYQPLLPEMDSSFAGPPLLGGGRRLADLQRAAAGTALVAAGSGASDAAASAPPASYDYVELVAHIGTLGQTLKRAWQEQDRLQTQVGNRREAAQEALAGVLPELQETMAGTLDHLLHLASLTGVDLEHAYLKQKGQG